MAERFGLWWRIPLYIFAIFPGGNNPQTPGVSPDKKSRQVISVGNISQIIYYK